MEKQILVPVNLSNESSEVLHYLGNLFEDQYCKFYLLDTFSYSLTGLETLRFLQEDEAFFERPIKASKERLNKLILEHSIKYPNTKHYFFPVTECSDVINAVKRNAEELDLDLIVLSKESVENGSNSRYGTKVSSILEGVRNCPVMVLPAVIKSNEKQKIVFASKFEQGIPLEELNDLMLLFGKSNVSFKIIQIGGEVTKTKRQETNRIQLYNTLKKISRSKVAVKFIESIDLIKDYGNKHSKSMICLLDDKPGIWRKLGVTKSPITKLGPISGIPLIALHA